MNEEIGKTVKLIIVWLFLYIGTTVITTILGHVFNNYEITKWTIVLGYMLIAILFFGKRYVELSFGHIEQRMVWLVVGMSVLIAASQAFALFSALSLFGADLLYQDEDLERRQQLFSGIAGALYCCVMGPIVEEIGFRGLILGGLLKTRCRPWIAILVSALIFALLHGVGAQFVTAMLFGILVGWLYWRTGSIIPGIIIHITNNSLTAIDLSGQPHAILWLILIVSLLLLAYCLWWFRKKTKIPENNTPSV